MHRGSEALIFLLSSQPIDGQYSIPANASPKSMCLLSAAMSNRGIVEFSSKPSPSAQYMYALYKCLVLPHESTL